MNKRTELILTSGGYLIFTKYLCFLFIGLLMFSHCHYPISAQTPEGNTSATTAKIKADVLKRGTSQKSKVTVKLLNGTEVKGSVSQVREDSFTVIDHKTKQVTTLLYSDVAKIKGSGISIGAKIAIGIGVFAAVIVVALVISTNGNLGNLGSL